MVSEIAGGSPSTWDCFDTMPDGFGLFEGVRDAATGRVEDFRVVRLNDRARVASPFSEGWAGSALISTQGLGRRFIEAFREVMEGRPSVEFEVPGEQDNRVVGDSGARTLEVRAWRAGDAVAATWRDVTERRQNEAELIESRERLLLGFEAAALAGWDWEVPTDRVTWSAQLLSRHGVTADEAPKSSRDLVAMVHPDDVARVGAKIAAALASGDRYECEFRMRRLDGTHRWVLAMAQVIRDEAGNAIRLVGVDLDVTESRRVEQEVREAERRLRLALDAGRMGTWDWDLDTDRVTWSDGHFTLLGYAPGECEPDSDSFYSRVHSEERAQVLALAIKAREDREEYRTEFRVVWPDGSVHWLDARGRFTYDESGAARRMYGVLTDIDHKKHAEMELLRLKETAESANRAKDEFLAALSHELRTPLTPVLLTAEELLHPSAPPLPESAREDLELIRSNVALEVRLIDDLLDLTRIARGKVVLRPEVIDVHKVLRNTIRTCEDGTVIDKQLGIQLSIEASEAHVKADTARLAQVLWNLIKNATKFTPAGGQVRVSTSNPAPGRLRVEVEDDGIGIAPELLAKIFDAFEQGGRGVTQRFGGLGLGLAIAKAMVDLHGGTLTAHSDGHGKGARFTLELATVPAAGEA